MVVIDPGDPASWPQDVADEVDRLAALCRSNPENADRPCFELKVGSLEESYAEERAFRDLIGERYVAYFHATRLLPHEDQMYADDGLLVLSDELRSRRLDRVIEIYSAELGTEGLEALRHVGAAARGSPQRENRIGLLHGVTPLDAVRYGGWGMEILMTYWGGESFYFDDPDNSVIAALTERSRPSIVEAAVRPQDLRTYRLLWRVFVGQLGSWEQPWHEFATKVSIPPERVLGVLHPGDAGWPTEWSSHHESA
jgi:hypothetical protein